MCIWILLDWLTTLTWFLSWNFIFLFIFLFVNWILFMYCLYSCWWCWLWLDYWLCLIYLTFFKWLFFTFDIQSSCTRTWHNISISFSLFLLLVLFFTIMCCIFSLSIINKCIRRIGLNFAFAAIFNQFFITFLFRLRFWFWLWFGNWFLFWNWICFWIVFWLFDLFMIFRYCCPRWIIAIIKFLQIIKWFCTSFFRWFFTNTFLSRFRLLLFIFVFLSDHFFRRITYLNPMNIPYRTPCNPRLTFLPLHIQIHIHDLIIILMLII